MKHLYAIVSIATLLTTTVSNAQIKKGSIFLGGDLWVLKTWNSNGSVKNVFLIEPEFGKAIRDNLIIGGKLGYVRGNSQVLGSPLTLQRLTGYSAAFFMRKYYFLGNSGFSIFAQGAMGVGYNKNVAFQQDVRKEGTFEAVIDLTPGLSYAVSRRFQLEAGIGNITNVYYYSTRTKSDSGAAIQRGFELSTNLSDFVGLSVGFRFLLGKKAIS